MAKRKAASTRKPSRAKTRKTAVSRTAKARRTSRPTTRIAAKKTRAKATARTAAAKTRAKAVKNAAVAVPAAPSRSRRATPAPARAPAAPRVPLAIVDEPDDELLEPRTLSSLDLEHSRSRLPVALAELEEDWSGPPRPDATLQAGDADADGERAYSSGDETPGGENPTPDQDVVDFIGRSLGVEYDDDEELQGAEKIAERDKHRWELNPASAEGHATRKR